MAEGIDSPQSERCQAPEYAETDTSKSQKAAKTSTGHRISPIMSITSFHRRFKTAFLKDCPSLAPAPEGYLGSGLHFATDFSQTQLNTHSRYAQTEQLIRTLWMSDCQGPYEALGMELKSAHSSLLRECSVMVKTWAVSKKHERGSIQCRWYLLYG